MKILRILLLLPLLALAQSPPTVTLKWQAVTTWSDGTPLPLSGTVAYNLYGAHAATGPWTLAATVTGTSTVRSAVAFGLDCYRIAAVFNAIESVPTAAACVTVTSNVPQTPMGLTAVSP